MEHYSQSLDLPFSNISLSFRELKTKDQILLSKSIISFSNKREDLLNYHNFVFNLISSCVQNPNDLEKINIIEYVLFLVKFRMISIGTSVNFLLNVDGTKKTKLKIDLKTYLTNLYNASMLIRENEILIDKDIEIKISWPNIKSIPNFYKNLLNNSNEYFFMNNTLYEFIEHIKFNNKKIILTNFSSYEKQNIFEKLSVTIKQKIQDIIINKVKDLIDSDLFGLSHFKDYKFNLYTLSFLEHIRLFFSYDLRSLYQEIYILSGSGLSTEYIMDISPTERNIYFSIMQEQKASQNKKSSPEDNVENQSLKDLALEFGDVPP